MNTLPDDSKKGLKNVILATIAIVVFSVLAIGWIASDYSGEYYALDRTLGQVKMELIRRPTSVGGTVTLGDRRAVPIADGRVNSANELELSFEPEAQKESGSRFVITSFKGTIDPPKVAQGMTTIPFGQVLRSSTGESQPPAGADVNIPRVDVQEKVIDGVLVINGVPFKVTLQRNSLTSMFRMLKSVWPGAS